MLIEAAIFKYLSEYSGLVGSRIYPLKLPQKPTLPAMTYQRISGMHVHSHSGISGLARPRYQFTCWAERYDDAKATAETLRLALDGYKGTMGGVSGVNVSGALSEGDGDIYDPDTKLSGVWHDFFIWHAEAKE
jgi:hypothetical protein